MKQSKKKYLRDENWQNIAQIARNRDFFIKTIFSQKIAEKIGKNREKIGKNREKIVGQWKKSVV
jgi:hypothetical protein